MKESTTLAKQISCEYRTDFNGRKCNSRQKLNNDKWQCQLKNQSIFTHVNRIMPGILVIVLASVTKTTSLLNT